MDFKPLAALIDDLEHTTDNCLKTINDGDFAIIGSLLSERQEKLISLEKYFKKNHHLIKEHSLENIEFHQFLKHLLKKYKKISKDNETLVDYISREKSKTVEEIKKLKYGKLTLQKLRSKLNNKRVVSKII